MSDQVQGPDAVRQQLERVLASSDFRSTTRLSDFLRFVVEETLAGRAELIKEYRIATRVFDRSDRFDPRIDPIVRIQAGRLRQRLERYYAGEGSADQVGIEIPVGGYVPEFVRAGRPKKLREPLLAVLPFRCPPGPSRPALLADGIAEELTDLLAGSPDVAVVGWWTSSRFRESDRALEEIGDELGAQFVLTGAVREAGDSIRISVRLIDADDSTQLWSETFDRELSVESLFELEREIAASTVAAVGGEYGAVYRAVVGRQEANPPRDLDAYAATIQFRRYNMSHPSHTVHSRVMEALERAVEAEPDYALAQAMLAECYIDSFTLGYDGPADPLREAEARLRRAINLDSQCQHALTMQAYLQFVRGDHEAAIRAGREAIELNPTGSYLVAFSGFLLGLSGPLEEGHAVIARQQELNPYLPGWLNLVGLLICLRSGDFEAARDAAARFATPLLAWDPLLRTATASLTGRMDEAAAVLDELYTLYPDVADDPESYIRGFVHEDDLVKTLVHGIETAADDGDTTQRRHLSISR